ncbi:MAG: FeoB-associated Cys-rich membrane protein [Clostridia bacterium]|nr:FeoB-associated Cys-rich membrane protein [Clostridia bacterium]
MATVIISLVLIGVVAGIITKMVKNKKEGKSSCGCGCSSCPMQDACHKK